MLHGAFRVVAAIVGGGLTLTHIGTMPVVNSPARQVVLAACGAAAIAGGLALRGNPDSPSSVATNPADQISRLIPAITGGTGAQGDENSLALSRKHGRPESELKVTGRGFQPGEHVVIRFSTDRIGSARADSTGAFHDTRVRIPADWGFAGPVDIVATGDESARSASDSIEIACRLGFIQRLKSCVAPDTPGVNGP